jgi:hypothetical protein
MHFDWIADGRKPLIIILMIAALMYVIGLGIFLAYQWQKEHARLSGERAISECLGSHGHIGPELMCWYDKAPPNKPEEPM